MFDIFHPVTGQNFIGREKELRDFFKNSFDMLVKSNMHFNLSLTGINRIGKTSLVKEACRMYKEKYPEIFTIYIEISQYGFWTFWGKIISYIFNRIFPKIKIDDDYIKDEIFSIKGYFDDNMNGLCNGNDVFADATAKEQLQYLFEILNCDLGAKIVIIIDEFDKAELVFGTNVENFSWLRTFACQANVSFITVSRRSIMNIEKNCFGGSTLSGIFKKLNLIGFKNIEIDEIINKIENEVGELSSEQREDLWYFCGRSPYYLSVLGNEIIGYGYNDWKIEQFSSCFIDNYDAVIKVLKEEKLLSTMLQLFIGPSLNLSNGEIDRLTQMGYATSYSFLCANKLQDDYADYIDPSRNQSYLAVSDAFIDYLSEVEAKEISNTWPKVTKTEKAIRKLIKDEYYKKYNNNWEKKLYSLLKPDEQKQYILFLKNHSKLFNNASDTAKKKIGNSILNVVSFKVLARFIISEWSLFKTYFKFEYNVEHDFDILYSVRNPFAHSNGELLTPSVIAEVEEICDKILNAIEKQVALV